MPWVKIDDGFFDNRTNRALGAAGRDLFIAGLCYCAKGLTDGIIAKTDLPLILAQAQAKRSVVEELVKAGRWIDQGDHLEVDEYLTYQFSRARVEAEREREREKKRRQRSAGTKATTNDPTTGRFVPPGTTQGDAPQGHPQGRPPLPDPTRPPTHLHPVGSPGTPTPDEPQDGHRPPIDLERPPPSSYLMDDDTRAAFNAGITAVRETYRRTSETG